MKKLVNINFVVDDEEFDYEEIEEMLIQDLANIGVDVDVDVIELEEDTDELIKQSINEELE